METPTLPRFGDVRWRWIAYAGSAFVVLATAFAFVHEVEMKQDVPCEIVSPSEIKIDGLNGLVSAILVQPSTRVVAGTPLFRLQRDLSLASDGRPRALFDAQTRDAQIAALDTQYAQRRAQLSAQLDGARATAASRRAEAGSLDEQIAQNQQLATEAARKLARLQSVAGYVTTDRIEQASADRHQSLVATAQARARRDQLQGELAQLAGNAADLGAQRRELDARHARDVEDLRLRYEQARQDSTISAPQAGVVTFSNLVPGRTLAGSDVALVIATGNDGALRAALRIPSRRRGFVRAGQTIRLKFDAYPYARYGSYEARIDSISPTTVSTTAPSGATAAATDAAGGTNAGAHGDAGNAGDASYIAWATLRGNSFTWGRESLPILPGMTATASIVTGRRTIAQWLFEPLFRMLRN